MLKETLFTIGVRKNLRTKKFSSMNIFLKANHVKFYITL